MPDSRRTGPGAKIKIQKRHRLTEKIKKIWRCFLMMDLMKRLWKEEEGQGMVEYGLIIALVSIAAIVILGQLGTTLEGKFGEVDNALNP